MQYSWNDGTRVKKILAVVGLQRQGRPQLQIQQHYLPGPLRKASAGHEIPAFLLKVVPNYHSAVHLQLSACFN